MKSGRVAGSSVALARSSVSVGGCGSDKVLGLIPVGAAGVAMINWVDARGKRSFQAAAEPKEATVEVVPTERGAHTSALDSERHRDLRIIADSGTFAGERHPGQPRPCRRATVTPPQAAFAALPMGRICGHNAAAKGDLPRSKVWTMSK
jgi:hypothetical protein